MHNISHRVESAEHIESMFPTHGGGSNGESTGTPPTDSLQPPQSRSNNPNSSIDDYNRVMLDYTQRQMAHFVDQPDGGSGTTSTSSRSARSSEANGTNGDSPTSTMARQATGPTTGRVSVQSPDGAKHEPSVNSGL